MQLAAIKDDNANTILFMLLGFKLVNISVFCLTRTGRQAACRRMESFGLMTDSGTTKAKLARQSGQPCCLPLVGFGFKNGKSILKIQPGMFCKTTTKHRKRYVKTTSMNCNKKKINKMKSFRLYTRRNRPHRGGRRPMQALLREPLAVLASGAAWFFRELPQEGKDIGVFGDIQFFSQPELCRFHSPDRAVCQSGNLLGGQIHD